MAWIRPRVVARADSIIISKIGKASGNAGYEFGLASDNTQLYVSFNALDEPRRANTLIWLPRQIVCGEWAHVAGTYDGKVLHSYLNGGHISAWGCGAKTVAPSHAKFRVSGDDDGGLCFNGLIDDVAFFTRALSTAEIEAIYRGTLISHCASGQSDVLDLLAQIDPAKNTARGICRRVDDSLEVQGNDFMLHVPCALPKAYVLEVVVTPFKKNEMNHLATYLHTGDTEFIVVLGKDNSCLIPIDGKDPRSSGTARKGGVFTNAKPNTIVYTVHEDRFDVTIDGETVLEWNEFARLKRRDPNQPFAFGGSGCRFRFERITFTPLGD